MAYVDKTFTFDASLESWTGYPGSGDITLSRNTSDGSPGTGCLSSRIYGKNKPQTESYWEWIGTWEDLGVTPGSTVTAIGTDPNNDYNWRCSEWDTGAGGKNQSGRLALFNNTPTEQGTIVAAQATTDVTTSWATAGGSELAVPGAIQASGTTIRLRIYTNLATANSGTAAVTILQDQIALRITYTAGDPNRVMNLVAMF